VETSPPFGARPRAGIRPHASYFGSGKATRGCHSGSWEVSVPGALAEAPLLFSGPGMGPHASQLAATSRSLLGSNVRALLGSNTQSSPPISSPSLTHLANAGQPFTEVCPTMPSRRPVRNPRVPPVKQLVTVQEFAQHAAVSEATVRRWIAGDALPVYRLAQTGRRLNYGFPVAGFPSFGFQALSTSKYGEQVRKRKS
jgi:hypothetical protein